MLKKIALAAGLALAFTGMAQAQTLTCSCDSGAVRLNATAMATLLGNRMICATLGNEVWQEWHNGSSSGPVVDYKLGPAHPVDPSTTVGSYAINSANSTVTYTYGASSYTYEVCAATNGNYTYCGTPFGGRNIVGARIGGSGLQSCSGVASVSIVRSSAVKP